MYFWKCWRDTRHAFLTFVGVLVVLTFFYVATHWNKPASGASNEFNLVVWATTSEALAKSTPALIVFAAFILGVVGIGEDADRGSLHFLLTRPRRRRYFIWSAWLVAAAELFALVLGAWLLSELVPSPLGQFMNETVTPPFRFAYVLRGTVLMFTVGAVFLGLTHFFTVMTRSPRHGTNIAVATMLAYTGLYIWIQFWKGIKIPVFWSLANGANPARAFPTGEMVAWLLVALAFPLGAQLLFERAEV